jgi:capsular polysaccharide biosynthesis protein
MAPEIQAVGPGIGDPTDRAAMPREIETPASAELLTLVSPPFTMRQPDVRHREIISEGIARAMEVSWNRRTFPQHMIRFSVLEDVYVVEEGLVIDAAGQLLAGTITQHSPAQVERGYAAVKAAMRDGSAARQTGTCVLCVKRGVNNFGHWLIEMLPKAYLAQRHLAGRASHYIVPAVGGPMRQVITDSLAMLRIDPATVVHAGPEPLRVESLVVIEGLTHHGVYMSPLVMDCMNSLSAGVRGAGHERLFVTRTSVARRLVNEPEIARYAEAQGFFLLAPGHLSLAEQIAAFKDAREIVGVSGAELANTAFAPGGARVINIAPAGMPDTFFWFIAGLKRHEYTELRCEQIGPPRGVARWDTDLVLTEDDQRDAFGTNDKRDPDVMLQVPCVTTDAVSLYLDLLIKCITNTIYGDANKGGWRPPAYDEEARRQGTDWPEVAHSMIGVLRLENICELTRTVLREGIPGDLIETGVWRGGACILMRGVLRACDDLDRKVYVADSFRGLPPPDVERYPEDSGQTIHTFDYLSVSQKTVADNFRAYGLLDERVVFVEGWFKDTLPHLPTDALALMRLDGDLYESTIQALEALYPKLSVGGFVIVDDYGSWPSCRQAVHDYRAAHDIEDAIIRVDTAGVYWRKSSQLALG